MKLGSERIAVRVVMLLLLAGALVGLGLIFSGLDGPCSLSHVAVAQGNIASPDTIYVDWEATGANDGTSWEDAFIDLQLALDAAVSGDEIWVAAGTYYPSVEHGGGGDRYKSFQMLNGVGIYGGFDPSVGDTGWEDRDWVSNATILSGDIGVPGNDADNCYHVFYHPGTNLDSSAILDGFTITGGNADGSGDHDEGGGMFNWSSSPTLSNCTFSGNSADYGGAGMSNWVYSSPTLSNCTFEGNSTAYYYGGGMKNVTYSSPTLSNCTFEGNSGSGMGNWTYSSPTLSSCTFSGNSAWVGGGMYNSNSSSTLTNCTFQGNSASTDGGGMYNYNSAPTLTDCIFEGNSASDEGGGMYNDSSSPTLTNCAFEGNSASDGGGMYNRGISSPTLTNCTFEGNSASSDGGGMYNYQHSAPTLTNCTFEGNSASDEGGGMYIYDSSTTLTNCILWGDTPDEISGWSPVVIYCDIQGGYAGEGNIDADPLWVDPDNGDYHLGEGSPCIDAGTNDAPNLPPYDFEGDDRIMDGDGDGTAIVDMGVDEFSLPVPITGLEATNDSPTPLGSATTLTATVTAGSNVIYTWAFDDGAFGSGAVVTHTYPDTGLYTAVVTASNSVSQLTATTTVTITDAPIEGLAATNDSPTPLGSATTLTATITAGSNVTYTWAFDDGAFGSGAVVTHTYPDAGLYTAIVTASNSVSQLTATTTVTITDAPIEGLAATNDSPTVLGEPTTLTATVAAGSNVIYTWAFDDGAFGSGAVVTHTYPDVGLYTAIVTASNSVSQLTATTTVTIIRPSFNIYLPLILKNQ